MYLPKNTLRSANVRPKGACAAAGCNLFECEPSEAGRIRRFSG